MQLDRRTWIKGAAAVGLATGSAPGAAYGQQPGERPKQDKSVRVLNPRLRVPLSFIIDDSTCLVNLNRFAIPQFAEAWKHERYHHDWRSMPHEIPDDFVRKFGDWCGQREIKGKYSIVPYPACVGRLDRVIPGWPRRDVEASIKLVRERMMPDWDIHPEMVTHTWVINTRTGHPYTERSLKYMENWRWADGKSVDQLADYMRYALNILKNVGLPCEGVTTPGGFASRVLPELSKATLQSVQDVFKAEIPHYFRHLYASGDASVAPRVENASGLNSDNPRCAVSIIGCTGDWTGGWDCSSRGDVDRFITADLKAGRMVDVIERGEPAVIVCHWTGIYFNGEEVGFKIFQEVVSRLHARFKNVRWMKLSEISRYWAAKELTTIKREGSKLRLHAPFACPEFTLQWGRQGQRNPPVISHEGKQTKLTLQQDPIQLKPGQYLQRDENVIACFALPRGSVQVT